TYATDLFDRSTIERLVGWFSRVVEAVVGDASVVVGEVDLLGVGERDLVLSRWSGVGVAAAVGTAGWLWDSAVGADPDAVAVVDGGREFSYREVDEASNRLARLLIGLGVGPERAVGVAVPRCAELVVAWWAVIKAGGVFVPVDRSHPAARVGQVLDAAGAVCVLTFGVDEVDGAGSRPVVRLDGLDVSGFAAGAVTDAERLGPVDAHTGAYVIFTSGSTGVPKGVIVTHAGILGLDVSGFAAGAVTDAERLGPVDAHTGAYVIFTSGSTGVPKGVIVTHAGILGWAEAQRQTFGLTSGSRLLMVAAPTFDASVGELLMAAASNAALVVAAPDAYAGDRLTELLAEHRVDLAIITPTVLTTLDRGRLDGLGTVVAVGEACPQELVAAWAPGRRMFNGYGPT
ncbi:AMP-binding protein, partial [Mycolicibacterium hassiacum]|uniref:AMP-binding protein n=1 Tax=Mycolicibacterium hassiacum TaxID=46351 RepID=UPI0022EC6A12